MPIQKTDREGIVREAIRVFKVHGYHNTSMADIGTACGLQKGSIYHHFKSKESLALAALEQIHIYFMDKVFSHAYKKGPSNQTKLENMAAAVRDYFLDSLGGCLFGNLALEVSLDMPEFKKAIQDYFDDWAQALTEILTDRYGHERAMALAREAVANIQGGIMMMRLYKNPEPFLQANERTVELLRP